MIISHDKPNTFNFWRDVFWSFSSFYSIVFVRSFLFVYCDYDYRGVGRSHVEDLPFYEWLVYACVDHIRRSTITTTTYSSFSSPSFYTFVIFFLHYSIGIHTIPWDISIYLLNKLRAQLKLCRELLGKVASLITTTSIIPLAVRVIGIELLFLMQYFCWGIFCRDIKTN